MCFPLNSSCLPGHSLSDLPILCQCTKQSYEVDACSYFTCEKAKWRVRIRLNSWQADFRVHVHCPPRESGGKESGAGRVTEGSWCPASLSLPQREGWQRAQRGAQHLTASQEGSKYLPIISKTEGLALLWFGFAWAILQNLSRPSSSAGVCLCSISVFARLRNSGVDPGSLYYLMCPYDDMSPGSSIHPKQMTLNETKGERLCRAGGRGCRDHKPQSTPMGRRENENKKEERK